MLKHRVMDALVMLGACKEARTWVEETFTDDATFLDVYNECDEPGWLLWLHLAATFGCSPDYNLAPVCQAERELTLRLERRLGVVFPSHGINWERWDTCVMDEIAQVVERQELLDAIKAEVAYESLEAKLALLFVHPPTIVSGHHRLRAMAAVEDDGRPHSAEDLAIECGECDGEGWIDEEQGDSRLPKERVQCEKCKGNGKIVP